MTTERTRLAVSILGTAILLGVLGDGLLRAVPWGVNLYLFVGVFLAALMALAGAHRVSLTRETRWLLLPPAFFALGWVWRDSGALHFLDLLALISAMGVLFAANRRALLGPLRLAGVTDYVWGQIATGLSVVTGPLLLVFQDVRWRELPAGSYRRAAAVVTGLAIAAPLVVVFGALLMGADAVFQNLVENAFNWDIETLVSHGFLIALCGGVAAGFYHGMLLRTAPTERPASVDVTRLSLGAIEVGVPLAVLNFLFLLFVAIQVRYLFGGETLIQTTAGLSYAEYARRGFFELVAVAGLSLPLLLAASWLVRNEAAPGRQSVRALSILQLGLLGVMLGSAVFRMRMYWEAYGLTEQRLYTMVFMAWLAAMLAWFGWTVLRGQRERFAFGAVTSAWGVLAALHLGNPDAVIAGVNLDRLKTGASFDASYVSSLSADATPTVLGHLAELAERGVCLPVRGRYGPHRPRQDGDWRSWNWSRSKADRLVREHRDALQHVACEPAGTTR